MLSLLFSVMFGNNTSILRQLNLWFFCFFNGKKKKKRKTQKFLRYKRGQIKELIAVELVVMCQRSVGTRKIKEFWFGEQKDLIKSVRTVRLKILDVNQKKKKKRFYMEELAHVTGSGHGRIDRLDENILILFIGIILSY